MPGCNPGVLNYALGQSYLSTCRVFIKTDSVAQRLAGYINYTLGGIWVLGQPSLHNEFQDSLNYVERLWFKKRGGQRGREAGKKEKKKNE